MVVLSSLCTVSFHGDGLSGPASCPTAANPRLVRLLLAAGSRRASGARFDEFDSARFAAKVEALPFPLRGDCGSFVYLHSADRVCFHISSSSEPELSRSGSTLANAAPPRTLHQEIVGLFRDPGTALPRKSLARCRPRHSASGVRELPVRNWKVGLICRT